MRSLGFNQELIALLSRIAARSTSRLLINGHLSRPFEIQRSVRQGDPLSMHLFVLYLHPLVARLEQVCGDDLLVCYADDITVVVTSPDQIEAMNEIFTRFGIAAGARLNVRKTVAINVGFYEGNEITTQWLQTANTVKVLGVTFANSIRLMTTINWDAMVGKFTQQMWLQSLRMLTVQQKVIMLNTFGTSKLWYLSSVLPPLGVHTAKITSTIGSFLWRGIIARVPMLQLVRRKEHGGLNLHLPTFKCRSVALNRHLNEIDSLPYYNSLIFHALPRPPIAIDHPDIKSILSGLSQIPHHIQQNPSADLIYRHLVEQTEQPKVERNSPTINWPRAWRNIADKRLSSAQRTQLYLLVNGKIAHRKLLFVMRKVDDENCTHCGNQAVETLQHKFCSCDRVVVAWALLQQRLARITNGWRRLSFEDLVRPALPGIGRRQRVEILRLFINYICFIDKCNGRIDVSALNFQLDLDF